MSRQFSKKYQIILFFILLPSVLFILIIIKLISKLILIRFGIFRNDVIGNSICNLDIYLVEKEHYKIKSIDLFFVDHLYPPNTFFFKLAKRHIIINSFARYFYIICNNLKYFKNHTVIMSKESRDNKGIIYKSEPRIMFNKDDNLKGYKFLNSIGLKDKDRYVCVLNRDNAYKNKFFSNYSSDHDYRNCNIETYEKSINFLLDKGYWVFRMGKTAEKKCNIQHERFIDYPFSSFKSDFLDIWLLGNCYFCLSCSTGIDDIVRARRIPMVHVNFVPIGINFSNQAYVITLFKKLYCNRKNQFLSLKDIINRNAIVFFTSGFLRDQNLMVLDNSSEEIFEATTEMCLRLEGSWIEPGDNEDCQNKFWKILRKWEDYNFFLGRINPKSKINYKFFENNRWFLD